MKTQGTSKFVSELVTTWLKEIRDPAVLDSFEKLIADRRKSLAVETDAERNEKLIEALARCKYGDVLYLMKPLPIDNMIATKKDMEKYMSFDSREKCKFYAWQPRKKLLWIMVPWKTKRSSDGRNLIMLKVPNIHKFQPSRTEASTRIKLQQQRST